MKLQSGEVVLYRAQVHPSAYLSASAGILWLGALLSLLLHGSHQVPFWTGLFFLPMLDLLWEPLTITNRRLVVGGLRLLRTEVAWSQVEEMTYSHERLGRAWSQVLLRVRTQNRRMMYTLPLRVDPGTLAAIVAPLWKGELQEAQRKPRVFWSLPKIFRDTAFVGVFLFALVLPVLRIAGAATERALAEQVERFEGLRHHAASLKAAAASVPDEAANRAASELYHALTFPLESGSWAEWTRPVSIPVSERWWHQSLQTGTAFQEHPLADPSTWPEALFATHPATLNEAQRTELRRLVPEGSGAALERLSAATRLHVLQSRYDLEQVPDTISLHFPPPAQTVRLRHAERVWFASAYLRWVAGDISGAEQELESLARLGARIALDAPGSLEAEAGLLMRAHALRSLGRLARVSGEKERADSLLTSAERLAPSEPQTRPKRPEKLSDARRDSLSLNVSEPLSLRLSLLSSGLCLRACSFSGGAEAEQFRSWAAAGQKRSGEDAVVRQWTSQLLKRPRSLWDCQRRLHIPQRSASLARASSR